MIDLPDGCPRGRGDCEPLARVEADDGSTFICVGDNDGTTRTVEGDCYRQCIRSAAGVDVVEDCDGRDLADQLSTIAQALSVIANRAV